MNNGSALHRSFVVLPCLDVYRLNLRPFEASFFSLISRINIMKIIIYLFFISFFSFAFSASANFNCGTAPQNQFGCAIRPTALESFKYNNQIYASTEAAYRQRLTDWIATKKTSTCTESACYTYQYLIEGSPSYSRSGSLISGTGYLVNSITKTEVFPTTTNPKGSVYTSSTQSAVPVTMSVVTGSSCQNPKYPTLLNEWCYPDAYCPTGDCPEPPVNDCSQFSGSTQTLFDQSQSFAKYCLSYSANGQTYKCASSYTSHTSPISGKAEVTYTVTSESSECSAIGGLGIPTPFESGPDTPPPPPQPSCGVQVNTCLPGTLLTPSTDFKNARWTCTNGNDVVSCSLNVSNPEIEETLSLVRDILDNTENTLLKQDNQNDFLESKFSEVLTAQSSVSDDLKLFISDSLSPLSTSITQLSNDQAASLSTLLQSGDLTTSSIDSLSDEVSVLSNKIDSLDSSIISPGYDDSGILDSLNFFKDLFRTVDTPSSEFTIEPDLSAFDSDTTLVDDLKSKVSNRVEDINFRDQAYSGWLDNDECPAAIPLDLKFLSIELSYQPLCDLASYLSYIVMMAAWLAYARITLNSSTKA